MAGKSPDYGVFVSERREGQEKAFYTRIGSAWCVSNDGISVKMQALPVNGELVLFPPRDNDDQT